MRSAIARLGCLGNVCLASFECLVILYDTIPWSPHGKTAWSSPGKEDAEVPKPLAATMSILVALKLDAFPSSFFIRSIVKTNNESSPSFHIFTSNISTGILIISTLQLIGQPIRCWGPDCVETSCGVGEVGIDVGEFQIQVLRGSKNRWKKKTVAQIRALTKQIKTT